MSNYGTKPVRSPAYPSTPLPNAIDAVGQIYAQYRLANVDREVAAKLLGYSGMNGPAAKTQSALAHYGLVERAGKGEMRVTRLAQSILYPDDPEERIAGLKSAALEPDLFRELQERFPDMIPPEDGVVTYLHRKGFNQSAIRPAARAYLETMLFIKTQEGSESHGGGAEIRQESGTSNDVSENMTSAAQAMSAPARAFVGGELVMPASPTILPVAAPSPRTLNKIGMNVQGHTVHIEALLDYDGLLALEKKIIGLKAVIDRLGKDEDHANDDTESS